MDELDVRQIVANTPIYCGEIATSQLDSALSAESLAISRPTRRVLQLGFFDLLGVQMSLSVRGWWKCALALAIVAQAPRLAGAQETEPNDTLTGAQVVAGVASGSTLLNAELTFIDFDPLIFDDSIFTSLASGAVNVHDFTGLPAGAAYAAYIDNTVGSNVDEEPDTVLRSLDEFGDEVAFDDDGSPLGNTRASGFLSTINADGSLHLEVSGYPDLDFDGLDDLELTPHPEVGEYALVLKLGPFGDVDFYRIAGLLPGSAWSAETLAADGQVALDTVLTEYDEAGAVIGQNDDIDFAGGIFLSALSGVVPASGEVIIAATAFPDYTNVGAHLDSGDYGLKLLYTPVPEPSTMVLGLGALGALCLIRRR